MSSEFNENYDGTALLDPLAPPEVAEFEWDDLWRRLGEADVPENDRAALAGALREVVAWLAQGPLSPHFLKRAGLRVAALSYVLQVGAMQGHSLRGAAARVGVKHQALSPRACEVTRRWVVKNRYQSHGWCRGKRKGGNHEREN